MSANRRVFKTEKKVSTRAILGWALVGMVVMAVLTVGVVGGLIFVSSTDTVWTGELSSSELRRVVAAAVPVAVVVGGGAVGAIGVVRQRTLNATHDLEQERYDLEQERHRLQLEQHDGEEVSRLRERYTIAAGQLGHSAVALRLAGVYSLAALADDWIARGERDEAQVCIDLLCAYLRTPSAARDDTAEGGGANEAEVDRGETEVRQTITQVITAHLQTVDDPSSWCGMDFNFTGAIFTGTHSFSGAKFTGGNVSFRDAKFTGGSVSFQKAEFIDGYIDFTIAKFTDGNVHFEDAKFAGGTVSFFDAKFTGGTVNFHDAKFTKGNLNFMAAKFTGGTVNFHDAKFTKGNLNFFDARFTGGTVSFRDAKFTEGNLFFIAAKFTGGTVNFHDAIFTGGRVVFHEAEFDINVPGPWGQETPPPVYPNRFSQKPAKRS